MGLDLTVVSREAVTKHHAQWSYHGFHEFRKKVANAIGLNLMNHYVPNGDPWPDDPLVILLNHSDCEGEIDSDDAATLGPRLREVIESWPESHDKLVGLHFCDMLDVVAKNDSLYINFG